MDLAGFQYIFWFEYTHRLLARVVGVFIALPLLVLWLTNRIDRQLALRILGVVVLIGLQGALGWAMVALSVLVILFIFLVLGGFAAVLAWAGATGNLN